MIAADYGDTQRAQIQTTLSQQLDAIAPGLGQRTVPILRTLDKLAKIGREKTAAEMCEVAEIDADKHADLLKSLAAES